MAIRTIKTYFECQRNGRSYLAKRVKGSYQLWENDVLVTNTSKYGLFLDQIQIRTGLIAGKHFDQ